MFAAREGNLHITLDGIKQHQTFDDNVHSAYCSCVTPRLFRSGQDNNVEQETRNYHVYKHIWKIFFTFWQLLAPFFEHI